jgi:hypothetical protein
MKILLRTSIGDTHLLLLKEPLGPNSQLNRHLSQMWQSLPM